MTGPATCAHRVGRILVRKLLLRGYPVTVLVRPGSADKDKFPESVKVVEGDVGDYATVKAAMRNVDKVCAPCPQATVAAWGAAQRGACARAAEVPRCR